MRDRTPTRALENGALRYGVYAEDGSLLRYEYLALEDEPADPGTELSKATLLQDSTEVSLFGSAADRTIDEAFAGIAGQLKLIMSDMATITLTVQDTNGKPIPEVLVQGILSESGQAVYTNASGVVTGYIGEGTQVIKVSGYADLVDYSETVTVIKGTTINKTVKLTTQNFIGITSSRSVKFSGNVKTIDFSVTSAGGGGASGYHDGGGGGSGGETQNQTGISVTPNNQYSAIIGSGGRGGGDKFGLNVPIVDEYFDGEDGGKSSFMGKEPNGGKGGKSLSMEGGTAGETGGTGGFGGYDHRNDGLNHNGGPANSSALTSFSEISKLGGGGGGGCYVKNIGGASGGLVGGGSGGMGSTRTAASPGDANTGGGGGGGGGLPDDKNDRLRGYAGAPGGSGYIGIRMHLKSAA